MESIKQKNDFWIINIFVKIIYFCLANTRNSFLIFSGLFFYYIFFTAEIYFQDNLDVSLTGSVILFLNKIPFLLNYIGIPSTENFHLDGDDLKNILIRIIIVFTTIVEILKYVKNLIFGKSEKKVLNYHFGKRAFIVIISLSLFHVTTAIFVLFTKNTINEDFSGFASVTLFMWIIHMFVTFVYLFFDWIIFKFQRWVDSVVELVN